jgi:hypothetical protein
MVKALVEKTPPNIELGWAYAHGVIILMDQTGNIMVVGE